ncbi:MAG: glucuronate isomerase [Bryobacteraceae bacterium]
MPSTILEETTGQSGLDSAVPSDQLRKVVEEEFQKTPIVDMHTHLFMPSLGRLGLWGIDELITYHYLEAELFRFSSVKPDQYWKLSKQEQADLIWRTLFLENTPVSEATRGVIAVMKAFELDTRAKDLTEARQFFSRQKLESHISKVFELAGITAAVMTNDPLDPQEAPLWEANPASDKHFHAVLRLDRILNKWADNWQTLASQGYKVSADLSGGTIAEVRRFLSEWCDRMRPVYMACSLPDTFIFPEDSARSRLIAEAVLPTGRERSIPLSVMIGVRYQVNPAIKLAGDAVGKTDLRAVEHLCVQFPDNRFLISVLSRENQHELCVYARKFGNLLPFGCWWFLNNPSIVEEMTRERIEMLGNSFIPQHSDARVLEQVIYKWRNTRRTMTPLFAESYRVLSEDGRSVSRGEIRRDLHKLFRTNFERWVNL